MKQNTLHTLTTIFVMASVLITGITVSAQSTNSRPRIGVYNSRSVALAYGRSKQFQDEVAKLHADAKQAEATGEKAKLAELKKKGQSMQDRAHRQVFGDAPIDNILTNALKDALPEIQKKANVERIVPKAPKDSSAEIVDVTDLMVQQFNPTPETLKMINELVKHKPLSPDQFPIKD